MDPVVEQRDDGVGVQIWQNKGMDNNRLLQYVMRWQRWIFAGLKGLVSHQGGIKRLIKSILYYLKKDRMKVQE